MSSNVLLQLSFDGKDISGWNASPQKRTLFTILSETLFKITRNEATIVPCYELLPGSHAVHFFVLWKNATSLPDNFQHKINRCLPEDVALQSFHVFDESFEIHPVHFYYEYHIHFFKQPFLENRSFFWSERTMPKLNLKAKDCMLSHTDSDIHIQLQKNDNQWIIKMDGDTLTAQTAIHTASEITDVKTQLPAYGLYATHVNFSGFQTESMFSDDYFVPEPKDFLSNKIFIS